MTYAGLLSLAIAIGALDTSNDSSQTADAQTVINSVEITFELQQNQLKQSQTDAQNTFVDTINPLNAQNPVPALVDQQQQNIDSSAASAQTNVMDTVITTEQANTELLGQTIGQAFLLMRPINEFLKFIAQELKKY